MFLRRSLAIISLLLSLSLPFLTSDVYAQAPSKPSITAAPQTCAEGWTPWMLNVGASALGGTVYVLSSFVSGAFNMATSALHMAVYGTGAVVVHDVATKKCPTLAALEQIGVARVYSWGQWISEKYVANAKPHLPTRLTEWIAATGASLVLFGAEVLAVRELLTAEKKAKAE